MTSTRLSETAQNATQACPPAESYNCVGIGNSLATALPPVTLILGPAKTQGC